MKLLTFLTLHTNTTYFLFNVRRTFFPYFYFNISLSKVALELILTVRVFKVWKKVSIFYSFKTA